MIDVQRALDAAIRTDFLSFLAKAFGVVSSSDVFSQNWHHEAIAWELGEIERGASTRLIVTMPPRYLKSITISVAWVAWMLGRNPSLRFVCVSYSGDLAQNHARDCRAIMQSDWYQRVFPNTRIAHGASAEMDFSTTAGGRRLSTSIGGTLTGRGGDIIVIDDPIKPEEAQSETSRKRVINWYSNTLTSRLNDKSKGAILLVMQRLHEEDLAGSLLESGGWRNLTLDAIADEDQKLQLDAQTFHLRKAGEVLHPEREPLSRLLEIKHLMGSANFSAQYQQAPVPAEGLHVKKEWFRYYKTPPEKLPGDLVVQSWDTASKDGVFNDYSVCVTALLRKRDVYILDVVREKLTFPNLKRRVIENARKFDAKSLLIEDAASGSHLIQMLKDEAPSGVPRPIGIKPDTDKITRFDAQSVRIENGEMQLPAKASWLGDFVHELLGFPNLRYDDQVDALSQLLNWRKPKPSSIPGTPMVFFGNPDGTISSIGGPDWARN